MAKQCIECEAEFNPPQQNEYVKRCGPCHYEHYRISRVTKRYGITAEELEGMYVSQNGCCALCGVHESKLAKRLHVDHCHDTGKVRGLLCRKCNTYIAHFEKEPSRLLDAYDYLGGE